MLKKLLSLSLLLSLSVEAEQSLPAKLVADSILLDIIAISDTQYLAVGERGHVITGQSLTDFTQIIVPTTASLTAVAQVNQKLWAVGHDYTIIHSDDNGQTWQTQFTDISKERPLLDVVFFDEQQGIAIGAYGSFMRTIDGGSTWQTELHASLLHPDDIEYLEEVREFDGEAFYLEELESILPHLNRVFYSGNQLYMAGESGMLAQSNDLGATWQRIDINYEGSFFDIIAIDDVLVAAGLRGNLFIRQGAEQWTSVDLCHTSSINSLFINNDKIVALSNNGYVANIDYTNLSSQPTCSDPAINVVHNADKITIINAITFNNMSIAVTSDGLAQLTE